MNNRTGLEGNKRAARTLTQPPCHGGMLSHAYVTANRDGRHKFTTGPAMTVEAHIHLSREDEGNSTSPLKTIAGLEGRRRQFVIGPAGAGSA
jgi:hypothetical protein